MAKTKKQGAKKKNASKKRPTTAKPVVVRSSLPVMAFSMQTCGVSNPFCPQANGARWPDNSYTKSLTFDVCGEKSTFTTSATGTGGFLFLPSYTGFVGAGSYLAPNFTYSTLSALSSYPTMGRWRLTSWGIKLQAPTSKLNTAGTLTIRLFSPSAGSSITSINAGTTMADSMMTIPLSRLCDEDLFVIPMPLGDDAREWRNTDTITQVNTFVNPGWQVIEVNTTDATASTVALNCYSYMHFEFVPYDGDVLYSYADAPPKNNLMVREGNASVLERIGNFVEGGAAKVDKLFQSKALKYFAAAAGAAFGGPKGAQMGYNISNQAQLSLMDG